MIYETGCKVSFKVINRRWVCLDTNETLFLKHLDINHAVVVTVGGVIVVVEIPHFLYVILLANWVVRYDDHTLLSRTLSLIEFDAALYNCLISVEYGNTEDDLLWNL